MLITGQSFSTLPLPLKCPYHRAQIFERDDKDISEEEEELKKIDQLSALLTATIEVASNVMNTTSHSNESDAISKMLFNLQKAEDTIEQIKR